MTGPEYTTALTTLNLTNDQAAIWLGVGRSTAFRYATKGPSGPAARAVGMAVSIAGLKRMRENDWGGIYDANGPYVSHSDLTAAVGLPNG